MDLGYVNGLLDKVKIKLESLDPARIDEAQSKPSEHSGKRMAAAKGRLAKLYAKLTTGRSDANKIDATGAKRG